MSSKKSKPLGHNPLDPNTALREMVRGTKGKEEKTEEHSTINTEKLPTIRKSPSTTTKAGLLRKTVYFSEAEWRAIKTKAYQEDRPYTDIIREAVQIALKLHDVKTS